MESKETRVGYMTIDVLVNLTKDYIKTHTINYKYIGDPRYLMAYDNLKKYLEE